MSFENVDLFPFGTEVNKLGNLSVGGNDITSLASQYGTPLYVYDEPTIRTMARQFVSEFTSRYPNTKVAYASKAFLNISMAKIAEEENLELDVVSGGEIAVAAAAGFPTAKMHFHGNNKTPSELSESVNSGVETIVVDGFQELDLLNEIARDQNVVQGIMLRLSP